MKNLQKIFKNIATCYYNIGDRHEWGRGTYRGGGGHIEGEGDI